MARVVRNGSTAGAEWVDSEMVIEISHNDVQVVGARLRVNIFKQQRRRLNAVMVPVMISRITLVRPCAQSCP